jgi:uncharacterized protein YbaP (TraB family)
MWKTAACALVILAAPLCAQPAPPWADIEAVEVKVAPGPALWHLTRGESEVWLLGTVGLMPKGMEWNRQYLSELLLGSRAIVMPPRGDAGLVDIAWFLLMHGSELSMPRGQTLEASLEPGLRARFVAARDAVARDAGDYATDIPMRAAIRLQQDMMHKMDLTGTEPNDSIADMARHDHIPNHPVSEFAVMDAVRDILRLDPAQQRACLAQAVDDLNWSLAHADRAARAWRVGDIAAVKANYAESRMFNCVMAAVGSFNAIENRSIADYVGTIDAALNQKGKTVVVIGMRPLLKKGGVLEKLGAMGVKIEAPAE